MSTATESAYLCFGRASAPVSTLPALVADGQFFRQATGARFTAIECTDFELLHWFLDGRDIRPVLEQRAAVGFNMCRVWTCYDFDGPLGHWILLPAQRPDFYARLPDFQHLLGSFGLYSELVAYTNVADLEHWDRLGYALSGIKNAIVEWRNEHGVVNPGVPMNPQAFERIPGILCSHGSAGADGTPAVTPYWDYATCHFNDQFEWWRKAGHNAMELWSGPSLANENTRYADHDQSLEHAYDAAAGAALLCAGACYHSELGKKSELWTGLQLDAAKAWVAGARSVNLECQRGPYVHRQDLEGPNDLRVYERPTDGAMCVVHIRK